jgi:PIN domain nuclease of toxin-antitoxin system
LRVLLDTQALLWWLADDPALTRTAAKIIADTRNTVVVSAASAWEIAIKVRLGKLSTASSLMSDFCSQMEREGFDRMLIAQSQAENIPVITDERAFDSYGVRRLW